MMFVKFYQKDIPQKGRGVFAKEFIPKGTLIWRLSDQEKYTKKQYEKLSKEIKKDVYPEKDYFIRVVGKGESWNHSCDANTWWSADNELSARHDIKPGEEFTYDYSTVEIDPAINYDWVCHCGEEDCRKHITWDDILKPEVYKKYEGHIPSWVDKFVQKNK